MEKTIILILFFFLISCQFGASKKEKILNLDYDIEQYPILYDTKYTQIKFNKSDVVKNLENLPKEFKQTHDQVFIEYLKETKGTIKFKPDTIFSPILDTVPKRHFNWHEKGDTIIWVGDKKDKRNYFIDQMYWSAYDLIQDGKCEIVSKLDSTDVDKIKVVYNRDQHGSHWTEFFLENDTLFFYALLISG